MPLSIDQDQRALADAAAAFARRHAPIDETRANLDGYGAGQCPDRLWNALLQQGFHRIHLPERFGGDDCGLSALAVVVEQFGRALLTALSEGVRATVVAGDGPSAARTADGWVLDGVSQPALGVPGAQRILLRAHTDGAGYVWFDLDASVLANAVVVSVPVDLTRSVGHLDLRALAVPADSVVAGIDSTRAELLMTALLSAESAGLTDWCLDTAVAYIRTREQFGRPVGSFQAVQHRAAMMLVRSEVAVAAAWDAGRAENDDADQQRLATAHAALTALPAGIDQALDCVGLLGGVGFTWEHDVHLYWRRAIAVASAAGAQDRWVARLGEAALTGEREFTFVDADTLPELRARTGADLDEVLALPDDDIPTEGWAPARGGLRRARLAEAGLVAPHLAQPYGLGVGALEQAVIADEFARRGLAQPDLVIGEWVVPTLVEHGSAEQQKRFVTATLRGEIVWCQLFSEPGAGSDLAGLTTRARRVDGGWVLAGQKVWNSQAREADWGVCLARTDPNAPKHAGITYFLIDMRSPGVDVRPLRQATGIWEFNEVFFDEVFVPDECVVGEPGAGWGLAGTTLSNERLKMGTAKFGHGSSGIVRRLLDEGRYACTREDALRVLGRNAAREMSVGALNLHTVLRRLGGIDDGSGAGASVQKVFHAIAQRDGSRALVSLLGPLGCVGSPDEPYVQDYLGVPAVLFGGGTIEIQLNLLARRVLKLPR